MKRLNVATVLAPSILALGSIAMPPTHAAPAVQNSQSAPTLEPVDHIPSLQRMHSWRALDKDTVLVWATPFRPYLLELANSNNSLRFAEAIVISESGGRIHSRFDSVYIDGMRYRISEIYKLSKADAKAL